MAAPMLHIFAVNAEVEGRHTYLSRSQNDTMVLPDLAGWLSVRQGGLDLDEIELFPVGDLAGMHLADYVTTAFDLEAKPTGQTASRMNALDGHVLLVPEAALAGSVNTKPELTLIASLPMARPDHVADVIDTDAAAYGQPSSDNVGWHNQKKNRLRGAGFMLAGFVIIAVFMMLLAGAG